MVLYLLIFFSPVAVLLCMLVAKPAFCQSIILLWSLVCPRKTPAWLYKHIIVPCNFLVEESMFINLGFWRDHPKTYDEACKALVTFVANKIGLGSSDTILDLGFGYGEQDIFWAKNYGPKKIVGLNISDFQVKVAQKRVMDQDLAHCVDLRVGSATNIPFEPGSFTKVIANSCAFHFNTREVFFHEALKVLCPGGKLITADVIPTISPKDIPLRGKLMNYFAQRFWGIPKENMYPIATYKEKLEHAGFCNVEIFSVREDVYPGLVSHLHKRFADPAVQRRLLPILRLCWFFPPYRPDFIIALAEKPSAIVPVIGAC